MFKGRAPIYTPALEGSTVVVPTTPFPGRGPRGMGPPGPMFPPIGGPAMIMPAERISVPSLMQRRPPTAKYVGPPSLMPNWGGYSFGGNYVPGDYLSLLTLCMLGNHAFLTSADFFHNQLLSGEHNQSFKQIGFRTDHKTSGLI